MVLDTSELIVQNVGGVVKNNLMFARNAMVKDVMMMVIDVIPVLEMERFMSIVIGAMAMVRLMRFAAIVGNRILELFSLCLYRNNQYFVKAVLDGMIDALCTYASIGATVRLGGFGSIRPGLNGKSQEDAKSVTADVVYRQKLIFVPGQRLKNMMKQSGVTRLVTGAEAVVSDVEGETGGNDGGFGGDGDLNDNPLG